MKEGRIVHFEDDEAWLRLVSRYLANSPHQVVGNANNLTSALEVLAKIDSGELDANVVILDGNLSANNVTGSDVQRISHRIQKLGLSLRTIGLSGQAMKEYGVKVDIDLGKNAFALGEVDLHRVIDELPEIEQ